MNDDFTPEYNDGYPKDGEENQQDPVSNEERAIMEIETRFLNACVIFVGMGMVNHANLKDLATHNALTKLKELIKPIIGNRNMAKVGSFNTIFPEVFEKVLQYCNESVILKDKDYASSWARWSVKADVKKEILAGREKSTYDPKKEASSVISESENKEQS